MAGEKKYIFVNGVMKLNPNYQDNKGSASSSTVTAAEKARKNDALAIVSTLEDINTAKVTYTSAAEIDNPDEKSQISFDHHEHTDAAVTVLQSADYKSSFGNTSQDLYQGLMDYFVIYEVPIGLLNKLLELRNYRLNFMIDDSGSMGSSSDALKSEATQYMPCFGQAGTMSRLEEEENRLHIFIDILAFIPTQGMSFFFMNSKTLDFSLDQHGKAPDAFKFEAHGKIREKFQHLNMGGTPTMAILNKSFTDASHHASHPTAHFLLTDGVPSDASAAEVGRRIQNRADPQRNPITLISCTNVDSECEWMKDIEGVAPFCSECDDFRDEQDEVLKDQGKAFPYTRGFWLLSALVGSMNPDDLDALDEDVPLTKYTLDSLLGREHGFNEYKYYFDNNPHSVHYRDRFERFLTEQTVAKGIVPANQRVRSAPHHSGGGGGGGGGGDCCIMM